MDIAGYWEAATFQCRKIMIQAISDIHQQSQEEFHQYHATSIAKQRQLTVTK